MVGILFGFHTKNMKSKIVKVYLAYLNLKPCETAADIMNIF